MRSFSIRSLTRKKGMTLGAPIQWVGEASVFVTTQLVKCLTVKCTKWWPNIINKIHILCYNGISRTFIWAQAIPRIFCYQTSRIFSEYQRRISKLSLKIFSLKFGIGMRYLLLLAPDRSGGCHAVRAAGGTTWTSVVKGEKQKSRFDMLQKMY